ncbi:MAG: glycosyltransferase family 2 protein [Myxococcaceae bacterium]
MPDVSVIVPCFNEEASLPMLVARLAALGTLEGRRFEVVAVDDGSRDGTWATLTALATRHPWLVAVHHEHNLGLAEAWHTGLERARGAIVCLLDADGQYRPEDIPRLLGVMEQRGVELVQGTRSWRARTPLSRFVISRATSGLLNLLFGMALADNKSGFIVCRREVLARLLAPRRRYRYFQLLLMVVAHQQRVTCASVDVTFEPRRHGSSFLAPVPLRTIAGALADVRRAFLELRAR